MQVVADKKKGAYLVIGISGEAELLSPTCTRLQEFQSDQGAIDWVAKKRRNWRLGGEDIISHYQELLQPQWIGNSSDNVCPGIYLATQVL